MYLLDLYILMIRNLEESKPIFIPKLQIIDYQYNK
jgi:hypothetical protein